MDNTVLALCHALKKTAAQLKPQHQPLSLLVLIGKSKQGKTSLLQQSHFHHVSYNDSHSALYFNEHGIIIELSETWFMDSTQLLQQTLKQINRAHALIKISGILCAIDVNELFQLTLPQVSHTVMHHLQHVQRFTQSLGYPVPMSILFTKLDSLAGFNEFFQPSHEQDLQQPLGFSLQALVNKQQWLNHFKEQFDHFTEALGQQVVAKIHPVRSSIKRTLIREFPLQLAMLRLPIQNLVHTFYAKGMNIRAIYFTSAAQGGISLDRLNQKIQQEYALSIQDKYPQSTNHRAFFTKGALEAFQKQTKQLGSRWNYSLKPILASASTVVALALMGLVYHHLEATKTLDEASKELLLYEASIGNGYDPSPALFHLTKAAHTIERINTRHLSLPIIAELKTNLEKSTQHHLHDEFIPAILQDIERVLQDTSATHAKRYHALKIYLMLADSQHFSLDAIIDWFKINRPNDNLDKKIALLTNAFKQPMQPIAIKTSLVSDVRNYLNALPTSYLYYSIAKSWFSTKVEPIQLTGYQLSQSSIPFYYTKPGFHQTLAKLKSISPYLQQELWVLSRDDFNVTELENTLIQAYCYDYSSFWQHFLRHTNPARFQSYQQGNQLVQLWQKNNTMSQLIHLIQQHTKPEFGEQADLFNQEIASQFTALNLLSDSAVSTLTLNINELQQFLATLSVIHDKGKTAFMMTKSRFNGETISNPLNNLYAQAEQLPEPVSIWIKQIANDTWFTLINDARTYINQQWQHVFTDYQTRIAEHYPFDASKENEVALADFEQFFAPQGELNQFINNYLKPFLDTTQAQWQPKAMNEYVLPISEETINQFIRANIITNMFFPKQNPHAKIEFSLEKINLDPIIAHFQLRLGTNKLHDNQTNESQPTYFTWPHANASLALKAIDGQQFTLEENGNWALFKLLQKINVLTDDDDASNLQLLFDINGNSGRYLLHTENQVNPFIPGILEGFSLTKHIV